jgi:hypothetical protein
MPIQQLQNREKKLARRTVKNLLQKSLMILGLSIAACNSGTYESETPTKKKNNSAKGENAVSINNKNSATAEASRLGLQALDCPDESRTVPAGISVNASGSLQIFQHKTLCKSMVETEKMSSQKYPTDIVFVLDITGSMQGNINSIKNSVVSFARAIEAKGWDARFGAIGFRDSVEARHNFSDARGLSNTLGGWFAAGGGDAQEYSQGGAREALKMFETDRTSKNERLKAEKVILLVTDNPGWDPDTGNHGNFDTAAIETAIQNSAAIFPRLRFFHSTSRQMAGFAGMSAHDQYNQVLTKTGVFGKGLAYPVTEDVILNEFVEQFKPVKEQQEMNCRLVTMSVKDIAGRTRSDAFEFQPGQEKQTVKITKDILANNTLAQIVGERCCNFPGEPDTACTQKVNFQIPLRIK